MKGPVATSSRFASDAALTNGRYELPSHARGVLVLANPPEAGWRMQTPSDEQDAVDAVCAIEDGDHA
jgi:hypothetical protein